MGHMFKNNDSCISNRQNFCVIFVVYTQFTNVAAGRIITTWRAAARKPTLQIIATGKSQRFNLQNANSIDSNFISDSDRC